MRRVKRFLSGPSLFPAHTNSSHERAPHSVSDDYATFPPSASIKKRVQERGAFARCVFFFSRAQKKHRNSLCAYVGAPFTPHWTGAVRSRHNGGPGGSGGSGPVPVRWQSSSGTDGCSLVSQCKHVPLAAPQCRLTRSRVVRVRLVRRCFRDGAQLDAVYSCVCRAARSSIVFSSHLPHAASFQCA